ncbi:MAG: hypothetical protein IPL73_18835 [Candidatus Obscuribacter sp.]|nr:hypothetical protein [Candidatus Obscuribacter sp.]
MSTGAPCPDMWNCFCFILMLSLPVITWIRFIVWMAIGFAIYFAYGYRRTSQLDV